LIMATRAAERDQSAAEQRTYGPLYKKHDDATAVFSSGLSLRATGTSQKVKVV